MKLRPIIAELLKENTNISEPTIYNNHGYQIVVCSRTWLRDHTYSYRETATDMYRYSGYIKSKPVTVDVRETLPYLSNRGLVVLFHFEYEDGRRPFSDSRSGPSDIRRFTREIKNLSKTVSNTVKNSDHNDPAKSKQDGKSSSNAVTRRPNYYYVFFQDVSHGHINRVSNPLEFKLKQDAIERATDGFTYNKHDKNGMKTWVEDSEENVIFSPKDSSSSFISRK